MFIGNDPLGERLDRIIALLERMEARSSRIESALLKMVEEPKKPATKRATAKKTTKK